MRKHAVPVIPGLAVMPVFLLHAAGLFDIPPIRHLEAIAYDARLRLTLPQGIDPRIVDIDEKSLAEEGRWPWGRDRMALDKWFDCYPVALAGVDAVSWLKVLEKPSRQASRQDARLQSVLTRIRPGLDHDRVFAAKLRGRPATPGAGYLSSTASDEQEIQQS